MNIIKPTVHPQKEKGESPVGYILRLMEANLYRAALWLIEGRQPAGSKISMHTAFEAYHNTQWCKTRFTKLENEIRTLPKIFLNSHMRFCPLCLKENGWCNSVWHLSHSTACSLHSVWLESECQHCASYFGTSGSTLTSCKCGSLWADIKPEPCPEAVENMQRFIERKPYVGERKRQILIDSHCPQGLKERLSFIQ